MYTYRIDRLFPEFSLEAYHPGKDEIKRVSQKDFKGKFLVLFFYQSDFDFVCPTELADLNRYAGEFKRLKAEVLAVSTDTPYSHKAWLTSEGLLEHLSFMLAADHNGQISKALGIYDEARGVAQRAAFIIDPSNILRGVEMTSEHVGRNAVEILRKLQAVQYVRQHTGEVCPASWNVGEATLRPSVKFSGNILEQLQ